MNVSIEDIKKLRDMTGFGVQDCKNALAESGCDIDKALVLLKGKIASVAEKRANNQTNEGFVVANSSKDRKFGCIVSLLCETDFVARTEEYIDSARKLVNIAIENKISNIDDLNNFKVGSTTISEMVFDLVGKFQEKIKLDYVSLSGDNIYFYNHNLSNKLSSLVDITVSNCADIDDIGKVIAVQVASFQPIYIDRDSVPKNVLDSWENGILTDDLKSKNDVTKERIIKGRLEKIFRGKLLLDQPLYLDNDISVGEYLKKNSNAIVNSFKFISISS